VIRLSEAPPAVQSVRADLSERAFLVTSRATALVLLCLTLTALSPHFLTGANLLNVLRQGALQFIMAAGLTLCVLAGGIDLSVGAVLGLSACLGAGLISGGQLTAGVLAALAAGAACGVANGLLVAYLRLPAFIATYGMLWIAHGLGYVFMKGEVIHGFPNGFRFIGAGYVGSLPMPVVVMLALLAGLHVVLHLTPFGRALYAIGGNPEAARLSGLPVRRHLVVVYGLSGLLAAAAGLVVIARVNAADSGIGEDLLLASIAAVVLGGTSLFGGVGGIVGTAVGSLILALVVNGLNLLTVKTFWQPFVLGVIVIVSVLADQLAGRARVGRNLAR
jgi:ribose transport system permease protein